MSDAYSVAPVGGQSLDDVHWPEIESKGYLPAVVSDGSREVAVTFYDPARLAQDVEADLATSGRFSSPPVVVVARVTRASIEEAAAYLAASSFASLNRW